MDSPKANRSQKLLSITSICAMQVKIEKPIMRIPMLAIHLNRDILSEGFKLNKQTHLVPVLATAVQQAVNKTAAGANGESEESKKRKADDLTKQLPKTLQVRTARSLSADGAPIHSCVGSTAA